MADIPGDDFEDDCGDEGDDLEADCGRWNNGRLTRQCRLAGSEWCDWDCPIGTDRARRRPNKRQDELDFQDTPPAQSDGGSHGEGR